MTEKTFNYTLRYYLFQMGRLKALTIFSCVFAVLGFPMLAVATNMESFREYDEISISMMVISIICICGTALLSFITPLAAFKHLYTKTSADNILSLPLTTTQRFIGDMGAILTSYSLPLAVSIGLSSIAENVTMNMLDKNSDPEYRRFALVAFLCTLQFIFLNTAIITCCGRLAEAILYPVAVNIVMPLAITYGGEIAFIDAFGVYQGTTDVMQSPVYNMFPFTYLLSIEFSMSQSAFWGLLFSAIYLALAYLGYRKRRAENIGKPFVFKYSYLVATVIVGIAFVICYAWLGDMQSLYSYHSLQTGTIVTIGVILLIMMLIMELINYRKIHSIPKFALHYAGTLSGGILICFLLIWSRGFGAGYYVPELEKIETAGMTGFYREADWENGVENYIDGIDEEAFSLMLEEHRYIVDNYNPNKHESTYDPYDVDTNGSYTVFNTHFGYNMKNGTRIDRNYSLDYTTKDLWERMYKTESYRLTTINNLRQWRIWENKEPYGIRLVNAHSDKVYIRFEGEDLLNSEILKALEADLKADTEYGRHNENALGVVEIGQNTVQNANGQTQTYFNPYHKIAIYESYTNTLAVLSQHGEIPSLETVIEDSTKNCEIFMLSRVPTGGIDMAAVNIYGSVNVDEAIFITADEFKELTSKQVKYNIFDGENTSDDYQYTLIRGGWDRLDQIEDKDLIIETLEKDGLGLDNYDFIDNYTGDVFSKWIIDSTINTEYNAYCDELFAKRTNLVIKEKEITTHEVREEVVASE